MGLLIALGLIGLLIFILYKQKKKSKVGIELKPNSRTHKVLTIYILSLSIIQAPLFYYYTFGLFSIFIVLPYLLISLTITGVLVSPLIKEKKVSDFHLYGVVIAILIGITSLIFGSSIFEKLDWKLRQKERELIVEKAIKGEYANGLVQFDFFPPISNGGNEVYVENREEGVTVKFFIDRGFIDHYSAFIYTTDSARIERFDARTKSEWNKTNKKISENWYRISE